MTSRRISTFCPRNSLIRASRVVVESPGIKGQSMVESDWLPLTNAHPASSAAPLGLAVLRSCTSRAKYGVPSWIGSRKLFAFHRATCTPASGLVSHWSASRIWAMRAPVASCKPEPSNCPTSLSPAATMGCAAPEATTVAWDPAATTMPVSPSSAATRTLVVGPPPPMLTATVPLCMGAPVASSNRRLRAFGRAARSLTNCAQPASHAPVWKIASAQLSGSRHRRS